MMVADATVNIASYLTEMARRQPGDAILERREAGRGNWFIGGRVIGSWMSAVMRLRGRLRELGIGVGTRVALALRPGVDFFAVTFALFKIGAVPVLIDPGIGLRNFGRCMEQAREPRRLLGYRWRIWCGGFWGGGGRRPYGKYQTGWFGGISLQAVLTMKGGGALSTVNSEAAAILFTSGSTGPAKGVCYTHGNFLAQVAALRETYGIEPGEKDLATFPLFGLFGPALGMTTVIPEMDFTRPGFLDPRKIIEPIQQLGITNMFGSPALLDRVGRYGEEHGVKLSSLRRVISAGAPASAAVLARFATMLSPGEAEIFPPYGATEALPVASIGSGEILGETRLQTEQGKGICIGRLVGNIRARVILITDARRLPCGGRR